MNRKTFIKQLSVVGCAVPFLQNSPFLKHDSEDDFYKKVVEANAKELARLTLALSQPIKQLRRSLGFDLANLSAGYVEPTSRYFRQPEVLGMMEKIMSFLEKEQKADGTLDFGNLSSPPDTAFIIDPLCAAARIIKNEPSLQSIFGQLQRFIQKACGQLTVGGVHTPNHRWVVSAALAKANSLFPNPAYVNRMNEWLSEVVFQDKDGVYLERSVTYAEVVNRSLIFMAHYGGKTQLLEKVKKNLTWLYYCMEPNGDMVTVQSRRQDAFMLRLITEFYVHYRYMAIQQNDPLFGAMVQFIETMPNFQETVEKDLLYYMLENPLLKKTPTNGSLPLVYEKKFDGISLLRKRKNSESLYLFAGADWPIQVASGRSTNPNFFAYRKGQAILKHVRLSTSFFSTGYFRGKGIEKTAKGYRIGQTIEAPYYQPLPNKYKKADGDYQLSQSTDGRFWNKMDFEHRPVSNVQTLKTEIIYEEKDQKQLLHLIVNGPEGVRVVVELCFHEQGELAHCIPSSANPTDHFLPEGYGQFKAGNDTITFGPGVKKHESIRGLEGELYSTHFGTLRTNGRYVFLTALCPFQHTLEIY